MEKITCASLMFVRPVVSVELKRTYFRIDKTLLEKLDANDAIDAFALVGKVAAAGAD